MNHVFLPCGTKLTACPSVSETGSTSQPTIAFNARTAEDTTPFYSQVIVFQDTILNIGDAYDNRTGIFKAPINGVYIFNAQMCAHGGQWGKFRIVVSNTRIAAFQNRNMNSTTTTSASVIHKLTKGDNVWVDSGFDARYQEDLTDSSSCWNQFSGALV